MDKKLNRGHFSVAFKTGEFLLIAFNLGFHLLYPSFLCIFMMLSNCFICCFLVYLYCPPCLHVSLSIGVFVPVLCLRGSGRVSRGFGDSSVMGPHWAEIRGPRSCWGPAQRPKVNAFCEMLRRRRIVSSSPLSLWNRDQQVLLLKSKNGAVHATTRASLNTRPLPLWRPLCTPIIIFSKEKAIHSFWSQFCCILNEYILKLQEAPCNCFSIFSYFIF